MDNEYLDIIGLGIFKALNDKRYPILVNGKISESAIPTSITNSITSILSLIPDAASSENKLADKNFVNSSIATNTATFRGTFDDLATLQATSADINDYAFYVHTDEIGNTAYDRYKHNGSTWVFEYTLNNSSFTAEQWSAINSGITTTKVGNYDAHLINYSNPHKVTKSQVGLGNVENVALSSWAGSNKITTLGTITTGVWNGTKITNTYLANSSITIGTTAISLGSTAKSLAGIEKLQLNDANSNLVYDSTTGSWKLTGNLLVTGFISAGAKGNSSSGGESTYTQREWAEIKIMSASEIGLLASAYSVKEAYNELNTAIETLAGKATNVTFTQTLTSGKQIGSISIDGKSTSLYAPASYAWSEITGKPSFATVATSGSYTDLANKPTIASLMGSTAIGGTSSYLYWNGSAWATKALGSNAFTSISKVSQLTNDSGYITGITKAMVEGVLTGNITSHTHSYLPLTGGKITGYLTLKHSSSDTTSPLIIDTNSTYEVGQYFRMSNVNKGWIGYNPKYGMYLYTYTGPHKLGLKDDGIGYIDSNTILHSSNYNSYAPTLTGTGASGTWGISISGNAATATNADMIDGYRASELSRAKVIDLQTGQVLRLGINRGGYLVNAQGSMYSRNAVYYIGGYGDGTTARNHIRVVKDGSYEVYTNGSSETSCFYIRSTIGSSSDSITIIALTGDNISTEILSEVPSDAVLVNNNVANILATKNDNVESSSKWANARTITLTGSVTGSVSIDGSGDVSLATTTNHTHTFASLTDKPTTISGYGITDAYTKTQTDTKLSGYLPLSGGTISGPATTLVNFNSTGSESGIRFQLKNVSKGWAGYNATYGTHLFTYADSAGGGANHTLGIRSNGNGYIDSNIILHSGNYNSYAPSLTGSGASGTWGINISGNAATATTARYIETLNIGGNKWYGDSYKMYAQWISPTVLELKVDGYKTMAWQAKELYTPRTIWGQSFDGTGDVSGALSGVTNITASGHAKVDSLKSSYICIECDNSGNKGSHTSEINNYTSTLYLQYSTSNNCCICYGGGNVGIGTKSPSYKLHIVGTAYASEGLVSDGYISAAATSTSSDIRLKDNISEISSEMALKWLSMLKPKSWNWNSLAGIEGRSMGFVAQDVEGILPQMIRKRRDNGFLSLDYTQLHALEVSALQSHERRIEELERENKLLREELNKLKLNAN